MKTKRTQGSSPRVTAGTKIRRPQLFLVELVSDGAQKATGDSRHDLQDELPFGPSRIVPELHKLKLFQYQTPFNLLLPSLSSLKPLVRSQKCGESGILGKRCTLETNHFVVGLRESEVYQYDVCISPEISCHVSRAVMGKLVSVHGQSALNGCLPAYDGRKHLYTAISLPFTCKTFEIELQSAGQASWSHMRTRQFKVVIKFVANVGLQAVGHEDEPQTALKALDVILCEIIGRSCSIAEPLKLGKGLEIQRSFNISLQISQKGLLLNIDVSCKVLMKSMPVIDYIALLLDQNTLDSSLCHGDFAKIKKALEGVMILVTLVGMCKSYRVLGLIEDVTSEFCVQRGDKTFVDYFQETYGYTIKRTDLPFLKVGTNQMPIFFPVEVCQIAEGQRYSKQLNRTQVSTLLKAAQLHPLERKYHILLDPFLCALLKSLSLAGTRGWSIDHARDVPPLPMCIA